MVRFAVLGATGVTGGLVLREALARGHHVDVGGRDPERLRAAIDETGGASRDDVGTYEVDVGDRGALDGFLRRTTPDVLLTAVGPYAELGEHVVAAAAEAGVAYVDAAAEQPFLRRVERTWRDAASSVGVAAVPGAGFEFLLGDLLGALAAGACERPREVHVAYALPRTSDLAFGWTVGTRRSLVASLAAPTLVLRDGERVEEPPGEARRLAWFPRPVGPHHAAAIPGGEALSLPRHVPGLRTVRTYLALPSLAAELLQAVAAGAARPAVARRLERLLTIPGEPSEERRRGARWACVAEAAGAGGTARAWAYGTDVYGFTAAAMVLVGERLASAPRRAGVLAPAEVGEPAGLLDELADRTGLRWSIARPS